MARRALTIILLTLTGATLGCLLAKAANSDWLFNPWRLVQPAPEPIKEILLVSRSNLWVRTKSGHILLGDSSPQCTVSCWTEVDAVPSLPSQVPGFVSSKPTPCVDPPPLTAVVQLSAQCLSRMFDDWTVAYALRSTGELFTWEAWTGGEMSFIVYPYFTAIGAVVGLLLGALCVFIIWGVAWLERTVAPHSFRQPASNTPTGKSKGA